MKHTLLGVLELRASDDGAAERLYLGGFEPLDARLRDLVAGAAECELVAWVGGRKIRFDGAVELDGEKVSVGGRDVVALLAGLQPDGRRRGPRSQESGAPPRCISGARFHPGRPQRRLRPRLAWRRRSRLRQRRRSRPKICRLVVRNPSPNIPLALALAPSQEKEESASPSPSPADLVEIWNAEKAERMPAVRPLKAGKQRYRLALARLREIPDLEHWRQIVRKIAASPFCNGDSVVGRQACLLVRVGARGRAATPWGRLPYADG